MTALTCSFLSPKLFTPVRVMFTAMASPSTSTSPSPFTSTSTSPSTSTSTSPSPSPSPFTSTSTCPCTSPSPSTSTSPSTSFYRQKCLTLCDTFFYYYAHADFKRRLNHRNPHNNPPSYFFPLLLNIAIPFPLTNYRKNGDNFQNLLSMNNLKFLVICGNTNWRQYPVAACTCVIFELGSLLEFLKPQHEKVQRRGDGITVIVLFSGETLESAIRRSLAVPEEQLIRLNVDGDRLQKSTTLVDVSAHQQMYVSWFNFKFFSFNHYYNNPKH